MIEEEKKKIWKDEAARDQVIHRPLDSTKRTSKAHKLPRQKDAASPSNIRCARHLLGKWPSRAAALTRMSGAIFPRYPQTGKNKINPRYHAGSVWWTSGGAMRNSRCGVEVQKKKKWWRGRKSLFLVERCQGRPAGA